MAPRPRSRAAVLVTAIAAASLLPVYVFGQPVPSATASSASTPAAQTLVSELPIPGGLGPLFATAGLAPPPRAVALLTLIRLLHTKRSTEPGAISPGAALDAVLQRSAGASPPETVPLPLSSERWLTTIFKNGVAREGLLRAILRDERASFLYYGLFSLDDPTLAYLDAHPPLLAAIYDQAATTFAGCARSIHIRDGALVLPGGDVARPVWEAIVGVPAMNTDAFVLALLAADGGRRAVFLDTVARLDTAHQAFVLGAAGPDHRGEPLRSLYAAFARFESQLTLGPLMRPAVDAAIIVSQVRVLPGGQMAPPGNQAFWRAALDGNADACTKGNVREGGDEVDAAWLLERVLRETQDTRRDLLNAIVFAQRVFPAVPAANAQSACQVVAGYGRFTGLVAALEQSGFSDPRDYLRAMQFAEALGQEGDPKTTTISFAQLQALVAMLQRVGAASPPGGRTAALDLARSLFTLPIAEEARMRGSRASEATRTLFPGRFGEWMYTVLVPRLCRPSESPDVCLQEAAAGLRANSRSLPVIEWEGQHYRVDPASAFNHRVSRIRERQHGTPIGSAIALVQVGLQLRDEPFSQAAANAQATVVREVATHLDASAITPFGELTVIRSRLEEIAAKLASARRKPPTAAADVLEASDLLLADALTSFAYAIAIGDPESSYLLADDPARRHAFLVPPTGSARAAPWRLAREASRPSGWVVEGSVFGLERACGLSWQRRLSMEPTDVRATMSEPDVHVLGEAAAALNPFAFRDSAAHEIAAAIRRGEIALASLVRQPEALASRLGDVGVSEWRVRAAAWLAHSEPAGVGGLLSLVELMWLGNPAVEVDGIDPWGLPATNIDGSLAVRMPRRRPWEDVGGRGPGCLFSHVADLHLRVAVWLDEAKLPAMLLPGVVSFAASELAATAQPADADDYLAVVRAAQQIPTDHLMDYVSALTADGTLVPVGSK